MKAPTCKLGKYTVKYKQVPYDDRYFFVSHEGCRMSVLSGERIIQIPGSFIKCSTIPLFEWLLGECDVAGHYTRIERFMGRVELYDKYLDSDMRE